MSALAQDEVVGGRYRVVRELGRGGMGVVYEAVHLGLGQPVALKVLLGEALPTPAARARFEREARLCAQLTSPYVVRIHDIGALPDGLPYFVMELLEGVTLGGECAARPVSLPELASWLVQVAHGVGEAHAHGVVHRDLKPANVLLVRGPHGRFAKVVDFGVSKDMVESTTLTQSGAVVGTPRYLAPECLGSPEPIDGRADVWAIGVMLYRLLSGRFPFDGPTTPRIAAAILLEPAVPLSSLRPDLPPALVATVERAMQKRPADRFATAEELAAALEPFTAPAFAAIVTGAIDPSTARGGGPTLATQSETPEARQAHRHSAGPSGPTPYGFGDATQRSPAMASPALHDARGAVAYSNAPHAPHAPRSPWPWILAGTGALGVVAVAVGAVALWFAFPEHRPSVLGTHDDDPAPRSTEAPRRPDPPRPDRPVPPPSASEAPAPPASTAPAPSADRPQLARPTPTPSAIPSSPSPASRALTITMKATLAPEAGVVEALEPMVQAHAAAARACYAAQPIDGLLARRSQLVTVVYLTLDKGSVTAISGDEDPYWGAQAHLSRVKSCIVADLSKRKWGTVTTKHATVVAIARR